MIFFYFICSNCGKLYYSPKRISKKKCIFCNKTFSLEESNKKKVELNKTYDAIKLLKYLNDKKKDNKRFDFVDEINKLRLF